MKYSLGPFPELLLSQNAFLDQITIQYDILKVWTPYVIWYTNSGEEINLMFVLQTRYSLVKIIVCHSEVCFLFVVYWLYIYIYLYKTNICERYKFNLGPSYHKKLKELNFHQISIFYCLWNICGY